MRSEYEKPLRSLLASVFDPSVSVVDVAGLGSDWAPVWRFRLDNGASVVVKTARETAGPWGSPDAVLQNERRAIECLGRIGFDLAPRLLAADETQGILVMSDVGDGPSVEDALFGEDRDAATTALAALARTTGILHGASMGVEQTWPMTTTALDQTSQSWKEVSDAARDLGFPEPVGLTADIDALLSDLADPCFRAFVHGDLTPQNVIYDPIGPARFVDFESSGMRHFAWDAAGWRMSFPWYGRWAALPDTVVTEMDQTYRAELAKTWPAALDDSAYGRVVAAGAAGVAVLRTCRLRTIASPDQSPELALRRRSQIVNTMTSFADIAFAAGRFEALAHWFLAVTTDMQERWAEARQAPRTFPAFSARSA